MKKKSEWDLDELQIYELGKKEAYLECLREAQKEATRSALIKRAEDVLHFLKVGYPTATLAGTGSNVWDKHLKWTSRELASYCRMLICDYRARLSRARDLYDVQQALIGQLSQVTEDTSGQ